jgi:hypothetical protein
MPVAASCLDEQQAIIRAKDAASKQKIFTKARKEADMKLKAAEKRFKDCKKSNSSDRAIIMSRGMARAAQDAGVKFPLKRDWHKGVGLGKKDNEIEKKLKLKHVEDAPTFIDQFAAKHDLKQAAGNAVALEALYDLKKGVSGGFIAAQVAMAIMDIVATVLSLGTYAAVAPAVHMAVGAGQKVSLSVIQKDIDAAEAKYANALAMRKDRLAAKTAVRESAAAPVASAAPPKKSKKGLVIGGAAVAGLAALAVVLGR